MNQPANSIGPDTHCRRNPGILHSTLDNTVLALAIDSGDSFSFDGPSGRIWQLLEAPISPAGAAAVLVAEFEIGLDECSRQVCSFFNRLHGEGLIDVAEADG
jgi:hypothetical protein